MRGQRPDPSAPLVARPHTRIAQRIAETAARTPNALAAQDAQQAWSYAELQARARALAGALRDRGVGAGDVVAVYAERSALLGAAVLAVLEAGATFLIIDADHPGRFSARARRR